MEGLSKAAITAKEWRKANADRVRAYRRKYYQKHRARLSAERRERLKNDPEFKAKEHSRTRGHKRTAKELAVLRDRYKTDPEYRRRYLERNRLSYNSKTLTDEQRKARNEKSRLNKKKLRAAKQAKVRRPNPQDQRPRPKPLPKKAPRRPMTKRPAGMKLGDMVKPVRPQTPKEKLYSVGINPEVWGGV